MNFGDPILKQPLIMLISKNKFLQPMPRSPKIKTCMNLNLGAQAPGFYLGASVPYYHVPFRILPGTYVLDALTLCRIRFRKQVALRVTHTLFGTFSESTQAVCWRRQALKNFWKQCREMSSDRMLGALPGSKHAALVHQQRTI